MKRDQYIPHEVSMRNTSEVMNLIEKEGMEGYGIYWALMEYLRTQDDYIGDIEVLKSLARQLRVRLPKLKRIMENYGLFSCTETTFLSPKLVEVMKPFEDRRARIEAYKRQKQKENSLEISDVNSEKGDIVSFEVKGKGEGKGKVTTSKEEKKVDDAVVVSTPPVILAWERYVDELRHEQSWIEIMAMRSGLGVVFVNRFPEVLRHFKRHIQAVGNEKDIQSSSDAKRYFNNFNTPGSTTFQKLVDELQKPVDKGKYKYEDRDPVTGQRSYCGVPIPADAPPRPNSQAVWCEDKWVF
jgi:hypothetical protein